MTVEVQYVSDEEAVPDEQSFSRWVSQVLTVLNKSGSVVIRLVDEAESRQLNSQYRHKNAATNVLSFPFEAPEQIEDDYLGDLVICVQVVIHEAAEQGKPVNWHWAHMVIHGVLHLLGYDHINDEDAEIMEQKELRILKPLALPHPSETKN